MPVTDQRSLPGEKGTDYKFVTYGGKVYVVYQVNLPGGKSMKVSWSIAKEDYDVFGIAANSVAHVSKAQFQNIFYLDEASEIMSGDMGEHPLQKYIAGLKEVYGAGISWISNQEFMSVFLEGFAEGATETELQQRLKTTKWYQSRTDAQRTWELETGRADRKVSIRSMSTRMREALTELYGANFSLSELGIDQKKLNTWAENVASGKLGPASEGFEMWLIKRQSEAEKVEGSQSWIAKQQGLEEQRQFMNRPEDMFEQIRSDALFWLGPHGLPDRQTLKKWAGDLVSGVSSEADFSKYLRKQAQALYPFLGPDEAWQDRASSYKRIVEEQLGAPINWNNPLLGRIGGTDANGLSNGGTMSFDAFTAQVRQTPEFWKGPVANEEGFDLLSTLNQTFNGVA